MSIRRWAVAIGLALLLTSVCGCRVKGTGGGVTSPPPGPTDLRLPLGQGQTLAPPLVHENLAVYPVRSSVTAEVVEYLTLDEALEKGLVQVTEKPQAEVNAVLVTNLADLPLYLTAGEVILGGKQDRLVSQDTIVPPHAKQFPVNVFCVEPHRWEGETGAFKKSSLQASSSVRRAAQESGSQERVWAEVARANAQAGVAPRSGAYRASAVDGRPAAAAQAYVNALLPRLQAQADVVGMVVAVNGQVVAADVYGSPKLFRKLETKLLQAHARDAVESAQPGRPTSTPTPAAAASFLQQARQGQEVRRDRRGRAETTQVDSLKAVGFQTAAPAAAAPGAPARPSPLVHENYYRNDAPPVRSR